MQLKVGEIVEGTVKSLTKFGAFVALDANTTGLVHISEVAHTYVSDLHEYLTEGQTVKVMVIGLDNGKINLSIVQSDDHDLDGLTLGQILVQIAHIGVRDLGNVDKSGRICVQRDERAEFCQTLDGSFNNFSNLQLHLSILIPHFVSHRRLQRQSHPLKPCRAGRARPVPAHRVCRVRRSNSADGHFPAVCLR